VPGKEFFPRRKRSNSKAEKIFSNVEILFSKAEILNGKRQSPIFAKVAL